MLCHVRHAVLHALVLRLVYVEVSVAVTIAGVKETTFELCVVEPRMIIPQVCAIYHVWDGSTDLLYQRTNSTYRFAAASCQILSEQNCSYRPAKYAQKPTAIIEL